MSDILKMTPVTRVLSLGSSRLVFKSLAAFSGGVATRRGHSSRHGISGRADEGVYLGKVWMMEDPNRPVAQWWQRFIKSFRSFPMHFGKDLPQPREKLVLLGTGWAALYFLSQIDPRKFDVTVISPRPYFVFTPLLTAALGGAQSLRAVLDPIRNKLWAGGKKAMEFMQGSAEDIDLDGQSVICRMPGDTMVTVPYDRLIVAVGSETNTFGIPGVREHCSFLKEVEDVREIRLRIFAAFEKANLPTTSAEEARQLLSFVIVGGGPAGVEAAAEINDLVRGELKRHFPRLANAATVTIIEMLPKLLPMFDQDISTYTRKVFEKNGISTQLQSRVSKIDDKSIHIVDQAGQGRILPYGFCLWASGVAQVGLAKKLLAKVPQQKGNRVLRVDPRLQVIGTKDVFALGDCAFLTPPKLEKEAAELYQEACHSVLGPSPYWLRVHRQELLRRGFVQLHPSQCATSKLTSHQRMDEEAFKGLLREVDQGFHPPIPTAQMARQAGAYLGFLFNRCPNLKRALPWAPRNYGALSYVGGSKAIVELLGPAALPKKIHFMGNKANWLWRTYYWMSLTSKYNRVLSLFDYATDMVAGRDVVEQGLVSTAAQEASF